MELLRFVKQGENEYRVHYTTLPADDFIMAEIYQSDLVEDEQVVWCVLFNEEVTIDEMREVINFMNENLR